MELSFATVKVRTICEKREKSSVALGPVASNELMARLSDLMACETMGEYMDLFPKDVGVHAPDTCAIRLKSGSDIEVMAGHIEIPRTEKGATDWQKVSRIKITKVGKL